MSTLRNIFMSVLAIASIGSAQAYEKKSVTFDFSNDYRTLFDLPEDLDLSNGYQFTEDKTATVDGVSITFPAQSYDNVNAFTHATETIYTGIVNSWGTIGFRFASGPADGENKPFVIKAPEGYRIYSIDGIGTYYVTYSGNGTFNGNTWTDLNAANTEVDGTVNIPASTPGFTTYGANLTLRTLTVTIVDDSYVYIPTPTLSNNGGNNTDPFNLTISVDGDYDIYYTTDGTNPSDSQNAQKYTADGIDINSTTTITAQATDGEGHWSDPVSATYTFPTTAASISELQALPDNSYVVYNNPNGFDIVGAGGGYVAIKDETGYYMLQTNTLNYTRGQHVVASISGTVSHKDGYNMEVHYLFTNVQVVGDATVTDGEWETPVEVDSADLANHIGQTVVTEYTYNSDNNILPVREFWGSYMINGFGQDNFGYNEIPENGEKIRVTGIPEEYGDGSIHLWPVNKLISFVFDENDSSVVAQAHTGVNVRLYRNLASGKWNTIVLPLNLTADQVAAAFGDGTKVASFSSTESDGVHFTTNDDASISANVPYLIQPGKDVAEPVDIDSVDITGADASNASVAKDDATFTGTYTLTPLTADGKTFFIGDDGKLTAPEDSASVKPLNAYFVYGSEQEGTPDLVIDGISTGINDVKGVSSVKGDTKIYNLSGQYVGSSLSALPKGVYIVNNKKVVNK